MDFKWQPEVKKSFLEQYPTGTAKTYGEILLKIDESEVEYNKSCYDFTFNERDEALLLKFKNLSPRALGVKVSVIKMYIYYCDEKGLVVHRENRFAIYTQDYFKQLVNRRAMLNKHITEEQLYNYMDLIYNDYDKAIFLAPYRGLRGFELEEIVNLQINEYSKDTENNILNIVKKDGTLRQIQLSAKDMSIFLNAKNQTSYVINNGEEILNTRTRIRSLPINKVGNYVFRRKKKNIFEPTDCADIDKTIRRIQGIIGNKFITVTSLYESGMINMALQKLKTKKELTKEDYIDIASRYEYGESPEQYLYKIKMLVNDYLEMHK